MPAHGDDDVLQVGLARAHGELVVEQQEIGAGDGARDREDPVVPGHALAPGALERRIAEEAQEERDAQVQRARLGVVEDAPAQHEGQGGGVPELEQRPADRHEQDELAHRAADFAAAGVGIGDQLLEIDARFDGFLVFFHGVLPLQAKTGRANAHPVRDVIPADGREALT